MIRKIFISYRRSTGSGLAGLIYDYLNRDSLEGKVFLDVEEMEPGNFKDQIDREMLQCDVFILLLTEDALERCWNPQDIMLHEILTAKKYGLTIIPVFNKKWPRKMPDGLEDLQEYHGIPYDQELQRDILPKLSKLLKKNKPHILNKLSEIIEEISKDRLDKDAPAEEHDYLNKLLEAVEAAERSKSPMDKAMDIALLKKLDELTQSFKNGTLPASDQIIYEKLNELILENYHEFIEPRHAPSFWARHQKSILLAAAALLAIAFFIGRSLFKGAGNAPAPESPAVVHETMAESSEKPAENTTESLSASAVSTAHDSVDAETRADQAGSDSAETFTPEDPETLASSGKEATNYLADRIRDACPLSAYVPEGPPEAEADSLYSNAIAAAALIAENAGNKNHSDRDITKVLDAMVEWLGDESLLESESGVKGTAAASIALLQFLRTQEKTTVSYVRAAQSALDRVLADCSSEEGGFRESPRSNSRLTEDNILLSAAFSMLYEKTDTRKYKDAAKSAETFVESMRAPAGDYFLSGDFGDDQNDRDKEMVSVATQALAALVMNDHTGIDKAGKLMRSDGGFLPDDRTSEVMSTECTALMALVFYDAGKEQDGAAALSAICRLQKNNGSVPESDKAGFRDGSGKILMNTTSTSASAWYSLACRQYNPFQ